MSKKIMDFVYTIATRHSGQILTHKVATGGQAVLLFETKEAADLFITHRDTSSSCKSVELKPESIGDQLNKMRLNGVDHAILDPPSKPGDASYRVTPLIAILFQLGMEGA